MCISESSMVTLRCMWVESTVVEGGEIQTSWLPLCGQIWMLQAPHQPLSL